jgi:hypothetical protein
MAGREAQLDRAADAVERKIGPAADQAANVWETWVAPYRELLKHAGGAAAGAVGGLAAGPPGALAAMGVVSAFDDLFGARAASIREERVATLFRELFALVVTIDQDKLDKAFLGSPEWSALVEGAMRKAAREWREEKLRHLARFLANAMTAGPPLGYRERLLGVVDDLTVGHLIVLRWAAKMTRQPCPPEPYIPVSVDLPLTRPTLAEMFGQLERREALGYLSDLVARGLAFRIGQFGVHDHDGEVIDFPRILVNAQGMEILQFVSDSREAAQ